MNLNKRPTTTERDLQADLVKWLKALSRDITVLKINVTAGVPQGFPDLLVLHNGGFIAIELKKSNEAEYRPNQQYYLTRFNNMKNGSAFVYMPETSDFVKSRIKSILRQGRKLSAINPEHNRNPRSS